MYNLNLQNYAKLCDPGLLEHVPLKVRLPYVEAFEKAIAEVSAETEHGSEFYDGIKYWKPPTDPENLTYLYSCDIAFPKMKTYLSKAANLQRRQNILHFAVSFSFKIQLYFFIRHTAVQNH